jgi:hypothetical protein
MQGESGTGTPDHERMRNAMEAEADMETSHKIGKLFQAAALTGLGLLGVAGMMGMSGCNGPWNMEAVDGPKPAKLWVSMLLVADRPLDTLWLERPLPLARKTDPSAAFVDAAQSRLEITETGTTTVLGFRPVPGRAAAWVAEDTAYRVKRGAEYALRAAVRWNAAADFPTGTEYKSEVLTAAARVPEGYSLDSTVDMPMEALHPTLSVGLPAASAALARRDAAYRKTLFDSLESVSPLAARGVTEADFEAYLNGGTAFHPVRRNDTVYYIFDPAMVKDYSGASTHRYSLPWLFGQNVDKQAFGGVILSEHFDSTRARIYDPLQKGIDEAFQDDLDSVEFYQRGQVRTMLTGGSYYSDLKGYPDTLRLTNLLWGYTGRNVLHAYSVDPLYYEYYKGLITSGTDQDGGLGGGSSRPQNVLRYSNVANGDGYFSAAVADSFALQLKAVRDTIPISALRAAWRRDQGHPDP